MTTRTYKFSYLKTDKLRWVLFTLVSVGMVSPLLFVEYPIASTPLRLIGAFGILGVIFSMVSFVVSGFCKTYHYEFSDSSIALITTLPTKKTINLDINDIKDVALVHYYRGGYGLVLSTVNKVLPKHKSITIPWNSVFVRRFGGDLFIAEVGLVTAKAFKNGARVNQAAKKIFSL